MKINVNLWVAISGLHDNDENKGFGLLAQLGLLEGVGGAKGTRSEQP